VRPLGVVEREVLRQTDRQFGHVGVALQVHVLMLHVAPQALDEDVVQRPAAPVHTDGHALALEHAREGRAGELRALVAVEDLGPAVLAQRVFQAVHAERRVHAVAKPPGQYAPRVPVDDRHQVGEPARQPDVRYVRTPHLVRARDRHAAQQVGIDLVLRLRLARVRPRRHARQSHAAHQALHALAIDDAARSLQEHHHAPAAVERSARVFLVDQAAQQQVLGARLSRHRGGEPPVHCRAWHFGQLALTAQGQLVGAVDPADPRVQIHTPNYF